MLRITYTPLSSVPGYPHTGAVCTCTPVPNYYVNYVELSNYGITCFGKCVCMFAIVPAAVVGFKLSPHLTLYVCMHTVHVCMEIILYIHRYVCTCVGCTLAVRATGGPLDAHTFSTSVQHTPIHSVHTHTYCCVLVHCKSSHTTLSLAVVYTGDYIVVGVLYGLWILVVNEICEWPLAQCSSVVCMLFGVHTL